MKRKKVLNQIGIIFVTCLLIFLSSQAVIAATYYIDYAGGNDSNNGTSTSTPWKRAPGMYAFTASYTHANGDVFVFKGGVTFPDVFEDPQTILLNMANSGGTGNPDIYVGGQRCGQSGSPSCNGGAAWGTGYPVFDGNAQNTVMGIVINGKSNIVIDGLKIYNMGYTDASGFGISAYGGSSNIEIKNTLFDANCITYASLSGAGSGWYFHHNTIRNSGRLHISTGVGVYNDIKIYNNVFEGMGTFDSKTFHGDGLMIGSDGIGTYGITNLKIYNNKFYGDWSNGVTALIYLNGTPGLYGVQHALVYNNQLTMDKGSVSPAMIYAAASYHDDIKIYNNTIDGTSNSGQATGIGISCQTCTNIDIQNNIIKNVDNGITLSGYGATTKIVRNNLYWTDGDIEGDASHHHYIWDSAGRYNYLADLKSNGYETNSNASSLVGVNPKIITEPNGTVGVGNWHLQSSSPAIGGGAILNSIFTTDFNGIIRGTTWDVGAYEYESGGITSYNLTVNKVGSGKVTGGNIDCGNACFNSCTSDTPVTLTATADTGYTFTGWSGGNCSGTDDCIVTLTGDTSVTAIFTATAAPVAGSSGDGGGGGGGCFIATAAYGSYLDPHVMVLREFRDKVLLKTKLGQQFVKFYYKHSPSVADSISKVEALRFATRLALTPVVYSLAYPNIALMLFLTAFLILMVARRRKIYKLEHACENTFFQPAPEKR